MTIYSYSRLSCFEQCPRKYKLKHIDKIKIDMKENAEMFLGRRVYETLERLYQDIGYQKVNTLDDLLDFFRNKWEKNWDGGLVVLYCNPSNSFSSGNRC